MKARSARILFTALIILALFPATGLCRMDAGGLALTPFLGAASFDRNHNLTSGPFGGLELAYYFSPNWGMRLSGGYGRFEAGYYNAAGKRCDTESGVNGLIFHADAVYDFLLSESFVPYLAAGAGGNYFSGSSHIAQDKTFLATWAGGLKYVLTPTMDLRLELRQYLNFNDWYSDFSGTLGLTFLFGK